MEEKYWREIITLVRTHNRRGLSESDFCIGYSSPRPEWYFNVLNKCFDQLSKGMDKEDILTEIFS